MPVGLVLMFVWLIFLFVNLALVVDAAIVPNLNTLSKALKVGRPHFLPPASHSRPFSTPSPSPSSSFLPRPSQPSADTLTQRAPCRETACQ